MTADKFTLALGPRDDAPLALIHSSIVGMDAGILLGCPRPACAHRWPVEPDDLAGVAGMHAMCPACHRTFTYPTETP
ncbi:hypothetical protein [Mycobacterium sp.]|uniref:hypothetical protein n=1 Tax=Mycobacterium sp. TaxID=1785 RepID=UPI002635F81C|nr:hypothetical protein [Mycobacterium sp.]